MESYEDDFEAYEEDFEDEEEEEAPPPPSTRCAVQQTGERPPLVPVVAPVIGYAHLGGLVHWTAMD